MNRFKLTVPINLTADTLQQYTFDIPTPDGYCVKVNRAFVMQEYTPTGTAQQNVLVALAAERAGSLTMLRLQDLDDRAIIAVGSLTDALGTAGSTGKAQEEMELAPEPYAMGDGLRALVGQAAVIVGAPTDVVVLFVVDYDVVKVTTKIATNLAGR